LQYNILIEMELSQKLDKMVTDIENITELYDFAERLYPYEYIRAPPSVIPS
jgi:hypothetical protein